MRRRVWTGETQRRWWLARGGTHGGHGALKRIGEMVWERFDNLWTRFYTDKNR